MEEYQDYSRHFREVFLDIWYNTSRSSYRRAHRLYTGDGSDMVNHLLGTNPGLFDEIFDVAETTFREKYPDEISAEGL